jgi:hypothetical protein
MHTKNNVASYDDPADICMSLYANMSLYDVFKQSPEAALKVGLDKHDNTYKGTATLLCSSASKAGARYGSYKPVSYKILIDRKYDIEYWGEDDMVSIFFTDVWYDPKTYRNIHKHLVDDTE